MLCPECFTSWTDTEDFTIHLEAHGINPWRCKQMAHDLKITQAKIKHGPSEPCKCPLWGTRFECELKIYRAK